MFKSSKRSWWQQGVTTELGKHWSCWEICSHQHLGELCPRQQKAIIAQWHIGLNIAGTWFDFSFFKLSEVIIVNTQACIRNYTEEPQLESQKIPATFMLENSLGYNGLPISVVESTLTMTRTDLQHVYGLMTKNVLHNFGKKTARKRCMLCTCMQKTNVHKVGNDEPIPHFIRLKNIRNVSTTKTSISKVSSYCNPMGLPFETHFCLLLNDWLHWLMYFWLPFSPRPLAVWFKKIFHYAFEQEKS